MATKKKAPPKKTTKRKKKVNPKKKSTLSKQEEREVVSETALAVATASKVTSEDCAAYSMIMFMGMDCDEEWRQKGLLAMQKFAEFGWCIYNAVGGLHVDWDEMGDTVMAKLKQMTEGKEKKK